MLKGLWMCIANLSKLKRVSLCGSYSASLHTLTFILYYYYSLINHIGYAPIRELQLLIPSIQSYRYVPIRELHLWIHSKFIPTTNRPYYSLRYIYMLDINISIYLITSFCEITICTLSESANSNTSPQKNNNHNNRFLP